MAMIYTHKLASFALLGGLLLACGEDPEGGQAPDDGVRTGSRTRGDDEDAGTAFPGPEASTDANVRADGSTTTAVSEGAFLRPFTELAATKLNWGSLAVELRSARVQRGHPALEAGVTLDARQTYVELELGISARSQYDESLSGRATWDLIFPDGQRISPATTQALAIAGNATAPLFLRYKVDEDTRLEGVILELNGQTRGDFAPERVPLDAPYSPDIDVLLEELAGQTLSATRSTDYEQRRVEIIEARASRNSLVEKRARYGTYFVELLVDVTAVVAPFQTNLFDSDFSLVVEGKVSAPLNDINELLSQGLTERVPVVFAVPDTIRSFTFRANVSTDASGSAPVDSLASVDVQL